MSEDLANRAEPDELSVGDFVQWDSSGGTAKGKIDSIERDGSELGKLSLKSRKTGLWSSASVLNIRLSVRLVQKC